MQAQHKSSQQELQAHLDRASSELADFKQGHAELQEQLNSVQFGAANAKQVAKKELSQLRAQVRAHCHAM